MTFNHISFFDNASAESYGHSVACINSDLITIYFNNDDFTRYKLGRYFIDFFSLDQKVLDDYNADRNTLIEYISDLQIDNITDDLLAHFINKFKNRILYLQTVTLPTEINPQAAKILLTNDLDISSIINKYKDVVDFCLNKDKGPSTNSTPIERYYCYVKTIDKNSIDIIANTQKQPVIFSFDDSLIDIDNVSENNVSLLEAYKIDSIIDLINVEFLYMLIHEIKIRNCGNCNKLFILESGHNTKNCRRTQIGGKKTCQQLAASKKYSLALSDDQKIKKQYYDRYYMKVKAGTITDEAFSEFKQFSNDQYKSLKEKTITLEEFENLLSHYNITNN